jgi:hypothetical protein
MAVAFFFFQKYVSLANKEMEAFKAAHPIPPPIVPKPMSPRS